MSFRSKTAAVVLAAGMMLGSAAAPAMAGTASTATSHVVKQDGRRCWWQWNRGGRYWRSGYWQWYGGRRHWRHGGYYWWWYRHQRCYGR